MGLDVDVEQWDSSVRSIFLEIEKEVRVEFLSDFLSSCDFTIIDNLYYDVINTLMVMPLGELLQKCGGNPSGQSNTTVTNTLVHILIWLYIYIGLFPNGTLQGFYDWVVLAFYGDDGAIVPTSTDIDVSFVQKSYKDCGFTVKILTGLVPIQDLIFLQKKFCDTCSGRGFLPVDGEKAISSMLLAKTHKEPWFDLQRITGLRLYYFNDLRIYNFLTLYSNFFVHKYDSTYCDSLPWINAKKGILNFKEIAFIHYSTECAPNAIAHIKNLNLNVETSNY